VEARANVGSALKSRLENSMNLKLTVIAGASLLVLSVQAMGQVTFYEGEGFRGRAFSSAREVQDFRRGGFNDRASSVIVDRGRWEVCEEPRFQGRCVVLRQGSYDSLQRMGFDNRFSSVRPVNNRRRYGNESPEPLSAPNYEFRRRPNERVYEAEVTSVHAVMGGTEQHCWLDREQVRSGRGEPSVAGGVIGGVIGGVLGHQIGRGTGRDIATVGGAVAGAAIGANVGRDQGSSGRDVRRCETVRDGSPDYWEVTYEFRNEEHLARMSGPPGRTIYVNREGVPRQ
jgi:uncharacterized protein YcfJ